MHSTPSPLCLWRVTTTITRRRCINVRADVCLSERLVQRPSVRVRVCVLCRICIGHFNSMVMAEQIVVLILLLLQNRLSICSDLFAILTQYDRLISRLLRWYSFLCVVFSLLFNLIFPVVQSRQNHHSDLVQVHHTTWFFNREKKNETTSHLATININKLINNSMKYVLGVWCVV